MGCTIRTCSASGNDIALDQLQVHICFMQIAISEAKGQLSELVRRAQAGDEVLLTRHGTPVVKLTVVRQGLPPGKRRAFLEALMEEGGRRRGDIAVDAARSQDFLYGEDGMPA